MNKLFRANPIPDRAESAVKVLNFLKDFDVDAK